MLKPFLWCLSLLCRLEAEIASETISMSFTCDGGFDSILGTYISRSSIECYIICSKSADCKSFTYDSAGQLCKTSDAVMSLSTPCPTPSIRYGEKPTKIHETACTMDDVCSTNGACDVTSSECRDGICQCQPGYSFQASTCLCLDTCSEYGSTFHEHKGHVLYGYGEEVLDGLSALECQERCVAATTYVCRICVYNYSINRCHLKPVTALTHPSSYTTGSSYSVFQRNCN